MALALPKSAIGRLLRTRTQGPLNDWSTVLTEITRGTRIALIWATDASALRVLALGGMGTRIPCAVVAQPSKITRETPTTEMCVGKIITNGNAQKAVVRLRMAVAELLTVCSQERLQSAIWPRTPGPAP